MLPLLLLRGRGSGGRRRGGRCTPLLLPPPPPRRLLRMPCLLRLLLVLPGHKGGKPTQPGSREALPHRWAHLQKPLFLVLVERNRLGPPPKHLPAAHAAAACMKCSALVDTRAAARAAPVASPAATAATSKGAAAAAGGARAALEWLRPALLQRGRWRGRGAAACTPAPATGACIVWAGARAAATAGVEA